MSIAYLHEGGKYHHPQLNLFTITRIYTSMKWVLIHTEGGYRHFHFDMMRRLFLDAPFETISLSDKRNLPTLAVGITLNLGMEHALGMIGLLTKAETMGHPNTPAPGRLIDDFYTYRRQMDREGIQVPVDGAAGAAPWVKPSR